MIGVPRSLNLRPSDENREIRQRPVVGDGDVGAESEAAEIELRRQQCLAELREKYVADTTKVQAAISSGKIKKARRMLEDLDTEFGWYVHDEVVQLASEIGE